MVPNNVDKLVYINLVLSQNNTVCLHINEDFVSAEIKMWMHRYHGINIKLSVE